MPDLLEFQRDVCHRFGAGFVDCDLNLKLGVSSGVRSGQTPVHGLRVEPVNATSGWYIWVGALSDDPDFFLPLHGAHLPDWCPVVMPYLALPPGWRFLLAPDHEDVWFDPTLLR